MSNIRNLTPHCVNICKDDGTIFSTYPSEGIARASQTQEIVGAIEEVQVVRMAFGKTEDLPAPQDGLFLIVSIITANAAKAEGRTTDDLLITADPVRDGEGKIIGCKKFALI